MTSQDIFSIMRWRLIKQTGWTIDYIDTLSLAQMRELQQVEDGLSKAQG